MAEKISVVVPAFNESESLPNLYAELTSVLTEIDRSYELIFVNDGSRDSTQKTLDQLYVSDKSHVRVIQLRNNSGKAAALMAGFDLAQGEIVIQMDADLQDKPQDIPSFLSALDQGYDLVVGWKQHRKDSFVKNQSSKIFNWATNSISKAKLHDHNCGFKAYRSEIVKGLNIYGELHRYIPVIVSSQGYRVTEIKTTHQARLHGKSKYGGLRFIHGFLDLLTVVFITRYRSRPLHFFGTFGLAVFTVGLVLGIYLTYQKFVLHQTIGDRPLLQLAAMLMIMGVQVSVTGLVGEQITTMVRRDNRDYIVQKTLK